MDKMVISLMCKNIKEKQVNVNELAKESREKAIMFMHDQYLYAQRQLNDLGVESQS